MADTNDMGCTPVDNLTQAFLDNEASAVAWWSNENAKLRADLAALRDRLRWVPVGERLPERDDQDARGLVMIWTATVPYAMLGYLDAEDGWVCAPTGVQVCVTHWQRSPAPPEPQAVSEVPNV